MPAPRLEAQVLDRSSGTPFASVNHQGTRYVVAEAGAEFQLKVWLYDAGISTHKVVVSIDGQDIGYTKIFYPQQNGSMAIYEGFFHSRGVNGASTIYKAFKFGACKPSQAAAVVQHPDEIKAGIIELECLEVIATGQQDVGPMAPVKLGDDAEKKRLPEGKKWFLAPGLKAEAGSAKSSKDTWSTTRYETVGTVQTLKIRYDTAENLVLRKILNPTNAAHRAILRGAKEARIAAMGREPDEVSSRPRPTGVKREAAAAAAAAAGGVKRERGIKREREDGPEVPRSASANRVDLTEQPPAGPLLVNGKALSADELAVCDLCDSDDDAPPAAKWSVQKKQAIEM